ncbi:MAG: serine hydrolase [Deltaproteobacteria bacterium]|nr:serine hydrolase [Deltaproteobacteria bacterium]
MKITGKLARLCAFVLTAVLLLTDFSTAGQEKYDLAYVWDANLDNVLDYKDELEKVFSEDISKGLKIVGRGREFGVIYDANASAKTVIPEIERQAGMLREAGFEQPRAIEDQCYYELYNVSYGAGPNVDVLKKRYTELYSFLGVEVGKNLFVEKISPGNYMLVYRRRGDKKSTLVVARRHASLLRRKKIRTSITPENNNDVVYGESSLLDDTGGADESDDADTAPEPVRAAETEKTAVAASQQPAMPPVVAKKIQRVKKTAPAASCATDFEKNIEYYIKNLRRSGRISGDEKTGWMVYDLENDTCLADINGSVPFQAASMIKPFVALAFFHQVKQGKLPYGPKSRRMMEAMIQRSSNSATNWVMRQAGGPARCEQILRQEYGAIFKNTVIREYIPAGGRTYKNSAPPEDYILFLRALWNKELPFDKELKRLMALPGRDRIYYGTPIPQGTLVYNKTGTTAHVCGDMGILAPKTAQGGRYPYAIVGIIERSSRPADYSRWMLTRGNVIREVSTLVYEEIKKQHRLM